MIVLDASITVGWLFNEATSSPPIDDILATRSIIVPAHWTAEIGHAALKALRRKIVSPERIDAIGDDLGHIAITIEPPISIDQMLPMLRFARLHVAPCRACDARQGDARRRLEARDRTVARVTELANTESIAADIRAGSRAALARAITLVESRRADHRGQARDLLQALLPDTGDAYRVGITGAPGVGKSTTIDALGMSLIAQGHRVAVLAVDPSSARTGGSILGDKTRMAELSANADAFIRPSPAAGTLGGVAAKTREAMLLCEAAGFDVVLVETVGIGQSETLMLPGGGDELQGIKKGLIELADMIAINKADGDNLKRARMTAGDYRGALHILNPRSEHWHPPVEIYSALTGDGLATLWEKIVAHRKAMTASGDFARRRREQQVKWMWTMLEQRMLAQLRGNAGIRAKVRAIETQVADGRLTPAVAAEQIADLLA